MSPPKSKVKRPSKKADAFVLTRERATLIVADKAGKVVDLANLHALPLKSKPKTHFLP